MHVLHAAVCEARRVMRALLYLRRKNENCPEAEKDIANDFNGRIFRIEWSFESTVWLFPVFFDPVSLTSHHQLSLP